MLLSIWKTSPWAILNDQGIKPRYASVSIAGVPADGVIDTGADITIDNGALFAKVTSAARLRKKDFQKADKLPRAYNQKRFRLDGQMDFDIMFSETTMIVHTCVHQDECTWPSPTVRRSLSSIRYCYLYHPTKIPENHRVILEKLSSRLSVTTCYGQSLYQLEEVL